VSTRAYAAPDGRTWTFRRRAEVRQEEAATHVTLLAESLGEVRVVTCLRSEWESAEPDFRALLARAVPTGGSRGVGGDAERAEEI
jgi:3-deoxy-D-manno-octulosonic-acid transferase